MGNLAADVAIAIYQNVEPDVRARELIEEECKAVADAIVGKHTEMLVELFKQFGDDPFTASEVTSMIKGASLGLG